MVDDLPFAELLANVEGRALDFKSKQYSLSDDRYKAQFIKDVLCMANTPRLDAAYIVLGVDARADGTKDLVGVREHPDDAHLQQLVRGKTSPSPQFRYVPVKYDGRDFGLIEIAPARRGPFVATWNQGQTLRQNVVYWRRGSSNDEARPDEIREISTWMLEAVPAPAQVAADEPPLIPRWDEFYSACHMFDEGWLYLLLSGPSLAGARANTEALGRVE